MTKFYVGQKVRDDIRFPGFIGKIIRRDESHPYPITVKFSEISKSYTADGRRWNTDNCEPSLFPVEETPPKRFEYTQKQVDKLDDWVRTRCLEVYRWKAIDELFEILQPEQPETFERGEKVLMRNAGSSAFTGRIYGRRGSPHVDAREHYDINGLGYHQCRKYDEALIGKVTE